MAFTYDLSTDRGLLRLELGDTDASAYIFEDAEIDQFLTRGGSVTGGTRAAIQVLLTSRAYRIKRATSMGVTIDDTAQVRELQALLAMLGGPLTLPSVTVTFPGRLPSDPGYNPITGV